MSSEKVFKERRAFGGKTSGSCDDGDGECYVGPEISFKPSHWRAMPMPVKFLVAHNARSDCGGLESSRSRRPKHQWMSIFADKARVASYSCWLHPSR